MAEPSSTRLAELRAHVAERLRPICADWPDELFDEMVESIATITLKYEFIGPKAADFITNPHAANEIIEDLKEATRRSAESRKSRE